MGSTYAAGLADAVSHSQISLEAATRQHLSVNHMPPISEVFDEVAIQAVQSVQVGDGEALLHLPNGKLLSAHIVVAELHLEPFLQIEVYGEPEIPDIDDDGYTDDSRCGYSYDRFLEE